MLHKTLVAWIIYKKFFFFAILTESWKKKLFRAENIYRVWTGKVITQRLMYGCKSSQFKDKTSDSLSFCYW